MENTDPAPPKSIADELREMPAGETRLFDKATYNAATIRSTITRIKLADGYMNYITRPEDGGLRVWRIG